MIEVGAGIGHCTRVLLGQPGIRRLVAVERESAYCAKLRQILPGPDVVEGTIHEIDRGSRWDAIVSVNVLEHIRDDEDELRAYARVLGPHRGHLCLFVPARPELSAQIDRDFGHLRRYTRPELRGKLQAATFDIVRLNYFNLAGYFAWWLNFRLLRNRRFQQWKVRIFDRMIFPITNFAESIVMRPPVGQSLIAVAQAHESFRG